MLPAYKESYMHYSTPSGNTHVLIYRRKKNISERKRYILQQKLLGLAALVIGLIGCFIMPDDCGACLFVAFMGGFRFLF